MIDDLIEMSVIIKYWYFNKKINRYFLCCVVFSFYVVCKVFLVVVLVVIYEIFLVIVLFLDFWKMCCDLFVIWVLYCNWVVIDINEMV